MNYIGISSGFHDAALTVIDSIGNITFAAHSERYSSKKHDSKLHTSLVNDAMQYINDAYQIHYYERPWLKFLRQLRAGERPSLKNLSLKGVLYGQEHYDNSLLLSGAMGITSHSHHLSHAAAGFQTSPFDKATVVVIDAIGEFDTISIWAAEYDSSGRAKYTRLWKQTYPDSIGLYYSAMTKSVGLRPLDEEYILMGMAAYGSTNLSHHINEYIVDDIDTLTFKRNLHTGVEERFLKDCNKYDIAASSQYVLERMICSVMKKAKLFDYSPNLVYMGGVALNCLANRHLGEYFENIWIMPNPGDAGSSLGAAALGYGRKLNWTNAYLGYNIAGSYPVNDIVANLLNTGIVGVASGRAEFGPRALGNRSLLADPRGSTIKDRVNEIKRRQKFRPFAPVILEEYVDDYFDMPRNWSDSRYMQCIAVCRRPDLFPAIAHADNTSRVQTVPADGSGIRLLLEEWFAQTGCPMLLNTSLNIRGEPMVNDRGDADRFEKMYDVNVLS